MIRPGSQNARILQVLADGQPHSAAEIHRRAGFMRLNSRVAELRSKEGLEISCEQIGPSGPEAFIYQLHTRLESTSTPCGEGAVQAARAPAVPDTEDVGVGSSCEQLTLEVAA